MDFRHLYLKSFPLTLENTFIANFDKSLSPKQVRLLHHKLINSMYIFGLTFRKLFKSLIFLTQKLYLEVNLLPVFEIIV